MRHAGKIELALLGLTLAVHLVKYIRERNASKTPISIKTGR